MDFRIAPAPCALTWSKPSGYAKTKTAGATFQGRKIVVQTPCLPVKIFRDGTTTTMYLRLHGDLGHSFKSFLESYEDFASDFAFGTLSSCLRNGSLRVSIWDDAQWFDDAGTFVENPDTISTTMSTAACILEFGGCWITAAGRWGLKWRVMQIRAVSPESPKSSPTESPKSSLPGSPKSSTAYAFIDDDS